MKNRLFKKAWGGAVMSAALLALCASCGLSDDSNRKEAKEEMKEELAEMEKIGVKAEAEKNAELSATQDSLQQVQEMEAAVADTGDVAPAEWKSKYNAQFFNNDANKGTSPSASKYVTTQSGLKYVIVTPGNGPQPNASQAVTVHYTGMLLDGTVFDSSVDRGEPATFPLSRVIPGWTEGLQYMKEGSTAVFYIPSALAYGERGAGAMIPPNAPLIFWVQLLKVN